MSGRVIIVEGPPLAGKTTLARQLAKDTNAELFIQDEIHTEILPDSDRNLDDRILAYDEMHKRAAKVLREGKSVILEGTYSRLEYATSLKNYLGVEVLSVIDVHVSPEEAVRRFAIRKDHPGINNTSDLVADRARTYPFFDGAFHVLEGTTEIPEIDELHEIDTNLWIASRQSEAKDR
ncbi:MAG: ATP-binding protein [Acidimicrobiia bacterium]